MSAPRIFVVAGEASGDQLGAALMRALRAARPEAVFTGVGGEAMAREGLVSLFPLEDIAVMGLIPVLARLPRLVWRIAQTARAIVDQAPDCLVIIDAPDFTHRVARRVRVARPDLPIVDYVSPTVWAWRPGRARAMRDYVDCLLALLPFEPQAHDRLGGPRCVYVGHPLVERLDELTRPSHDRGGARSLLVLPGSRLAEVRRMTPIYGEALELLLRERADFEVVIPVAPNVEKTLLRELRGWPMTPRLIGQAEKFAAFRNARAALVTSGVATLELALAGVPMAVAYKVSRAESLLRFLVKVDSIVLPNLVIGENIVPEFLQEAATPHALAEALRPLLRESAARDAQLAAFKRVRARLLEAGRTPSVRAADIILEYASRGRG
ncbi:lipid-A-disaccharide synthase [Methylocystis sp. H62]|uniref:lipid-A-disaccharide synthase n=1 Tax=Methylocystis sp. H62 TaxID=2785789 RepID=UPI0018C33C83|nr:lipid-A-disaccharide synthase [Methylocystis sp. H62]MBG0795817.1 lipid-A-disaccharide synthase [Methylocystis sp. H62]